MGKWINCKNCGHYYHTDLARCPECGKYTLSFGKIAGIIAISAVCICAVVGIALGLADKAPSAPDVASGFINRDKLYSQLSEIKSTVSGDESSSKEASSSDTVSEETSSKTNSSKETSSSKKSSSQKSSSQVPSSSQVSSSKPSSSQVSSSEDDKLVITEDPYWEMFAVRDKDGAILYINQTVYITYPDYMVYVLFGDGEVTLSAEMQNAGFTSATRNGNGSATFTIPPDRYIEYCDYLWDTYSEIFVELAKTEEITDLTHTQDYSEVNFTFNYAEATEEDVEGAVLIGCLVNELQLIDLDFKLGCEVKFYYKDSTEPVVYSFPDIFKQAYEQSKQ